MATARASTNTLLKQYIEIDKHPGKPNIRPAHPNNQLTIGDLHSNALKFLNFLIRENIVEMPPEDYQKIVNEIYYKNPYKFQRSDLDSFIKIISSAKINTHTAIRLLGDELADRGQNDIFILLILDILIQKGVPVEILLSNHGLEFIQHYEQKHLVNTEDEEKQPKELKQIWLKQPNQTHSLHRLYHFIKKNIVSNEEIERLVENVYKPCLKALSYTLSEDESQITLHSHAKIGVKNIAFIAHKLNHIRARLAEAGIVPFELDIEFKDNTPAELGRSIDAINAAIAHYAKQNALHVLFKGEKIFGSAIDNPLIFLLWNCNDDLIERPRQHPDHGYDIHYVHGHTPGETTDYTFGMDNTLGKGEERSDYRGVDTVLFSQDKTKPDFIPRLDEEQEQEEDNEVRGTTAPSSPINTPLPVPENRRATI